jgi:hypothetical protein
VEVEADSTSPLDRPVRDVTLSEEKASKKLLLLGGLSALVFALAAGVVAFLLVGPRP